MHKGQYLSIGEVSKLTRVNIKSLRYYDEIGVLTPAHTDPETGYRYYLPAQLGYLDAIRFCIDVGIPLREFSQYTADGTINAELLLKNASAIATKKMKAIEEGLRFIEYLEGIVQHSEKLIAAGRPIRCRAREKKYIIEPLTHRFEILDFSRNLSHLQLRALENDYRMGYDYGELMIWRDNSDTPEHYAYTEILGSGKPMDGTIHFPAAEFTAMHVHETKIEHAPELFSKEFSIPGDKIVFQTEVISSIFDTNRHSYELRCTVQPHQA